MRVFVAGATGVIGRLLLEQLREAGHEVVGTTRAPDRAEALGAKPPRRVPVWLARWVAGKQAAVMATRLEGATNPKAKRELAWGLRYPSWRQGFREALG
jgi:nucleoside-diphosphate-sugar epimerase